VATWGRRQIFHLDNHELVLKQGRAAETLHVLLSARGSFLSLAEIAARVASQSGKPVQSPEAVREALSRLRAALEPVRSDWKDLIVHDRTHGYRIPASE
jgi:DNA-binding response OmpR family regulator